MIVGRSALLMRITGQDRLIEEAVERYTDGVPEAEHYLAVRDGR
jgi:hypothetical protein